MRLFVAILCAVLAGPLAAGESCGVITVGMYESGLLYYQHDGRWKGINKDVLDEVSRRTSCSFKLTLESTTRIWAGIDAGTLGMTVTALHTPEREKLAYLVPYIVSRNYVLIQQQVPPEARTPEGFLNSEYRVGVVKAYHHGPFYDAWLDKMRERGRVYEAPDVYSLVNLMRNQRVHALIGPNANWTYMRDLELDGNVMRINWAGDERLVAHLALSRRLVSESNYRRIQRAAAEMRSDGTLEKIYRRYVVPEMARDMATLP